MENILLYLSCIFFIYFFIIPIETIIWLNVKTILKNTIYLTTFFIKLICIILFIFNILI